VETESARKDRKMKTGRQAKKRCRVESVIFQDENSCTMSLPKRIFQRTDLMLVAVGSLSCVRALYLQAADLGKLHQFCYCCMTPTEYALGTGGRRLKKELEKVLKKTGIGGVIVYVSCMEVITRMELEELLSSLNNPDRVPVKVLYRGPMVSRYQKPAESLSQILLSIPETGRKIEGDSLILPPVPPDFAGIAECLQSWDTYNFLITPGGCTGCMIGRADGKQAYRLRKSRFHDMEAAMGCEQIVLEGIAADAKETADGKLCCLLGTAVPHLLSFDYERVSEELQERGISSVFLKSDGFHSAVQGIAGAYLTLGKQRIRKEPAVPKLIGILGAHSLYCVGRNQWKYTVEHLEREGYQCLFPEETDGFSEWGRVSMNWVVSAEGFTLAKWMQEELDIPYLTMLPIGEQAVNSWQKEIQRKMRKKKVEKRKFPQQEFAASDLRRVVLIGDPVVTKGIACYLQEEREYQNICQAVYTPLQAMKQWYQEVYESEEDKEELICFSNPEELEQLLQRAELVIGDAVFKRAVEADKIEKNWICLPDPVFMSGNREPPVDYELFGKKGGAWLDGQLKRIIAYGSNEFAGKEFAIEKMKKEKIK
jgi:hypothetical protein